jgi:nitrate/nitrite-specific signal transduction histidine kinase
MGEAGPAGHYGLKIMHERAQEIGAEFEIHSIPGAGTRVALGLPMNHNFAPQQLPIKGVN